VVIGGIGELVTNDPELGVSAGAAVVVEGERVVWVGPDHAAPAADERIEVGGRAVLVRTGWQRHWRTDEYVSGRHPFLTEAAAAYLLSVQPAGNLVVLRTGPGQASALALEIDRAGLEGIAGTVAVEPRQTMFLPSPV